MNASRGLICWFSRYVNRDTAASIGSHKMHFKDNSPFKTHNDLTMFYLLSWYSLIIHSKISPFSMRIPFSSIIAANFLLSIVSLVRSRLRRYSFLLNGRCCKLNIMNLLWSSVSYTSSSHRRVTNSGFWSQNRY